MSTEQSGRPPRFAAVGTGYPPGVRQLARVEWGVSRRQPLERAAHAAEGKGLGGEMVSVFAAPEDAGELAAECPDEPTDGLFGALRQGALMDRAFVGGNLVA